MTIHARQSLSINTLFVFVLYLQNVCNVTSKMFTKSPWSGDVSKQVTIKRSPKPSLILLFMYLSNLGPRNIKTTITRYCQLLRSGLRSNHGLPALQRPRKKVLKNAQITIISHVKQRPVNFFTVAENGDQLPTTSLLPCQSRQPSCPDPGELARYCHGADHS